MINPAAGSGAICPSTYPSTSGAGSAQSNALAGESDRRHSLDHKKITDFFYKHRAIWEDIAYAFGLGQPDSDAIEKAHRFTKDRMKAVFREVQRRKQADGKELNVQDIRQALKDIRWNYTLPLEEFNRLITENPNHFYCEPTRLLKPRETEPPELFLARKEIAALKKRLRESTDNNRKMRRDIANQALGLETTKQHYQTRIATLQAEIRQNSQRWEQEKAELLRHVSQQRQQLQTLKHQQQQTRDPVSVALALADGHREPQGGSVLPAAAKLPPPAASDKPHGLVAIVAPWNAVVTPRIAAVTVPPALRDRRLRLCTLLNGDIKDKLRFHWAGLKSAFNSARPEFSPSCHPIPDREDDYLGREHPDIDNRYTTVILQMLARTDMTYGDFERVLRKLPQFTDEVNINELIEALNSIPSSVPG